MIMTYMLKNNHVNMGRKSIIYKNTHTLFTKLGIYQELSKKIRNKLNNVVGCQCFELVYSLI